jgi:pimeloyl-ACP methyl ester carboxylesterase
MQLNYSRDGTGEPLVLMHGIGSRWQMWEPVIGRLAQRHDVIAVDLPGFGASPLPPPGTPPGIDSQVQLVSEFMAQLGVERPHVAGNSMGGLMALEMASRGLARSATALSPAGFATRAEMTYGRISLWLSVRLARRAARYADTLFATETGRKLGLSLFVGRPERLSGAEAADNTRALAGAPWFDETLPALRAYDFTAGDAITVPVTVAWGSQDRLLLPRQARRAARTIPRARVLMLHGCGHVPTWDDPEQVAQVILDGARAPAPSSAVPATAAAWPQVASSPVATGREESVTHSLQDPGYNAAPGTPANSRASTVWAAVIPEPQ